MELRHYIQMILKGWGWVVLTTLLALATSLLISITTTPQYQATTSFIVLPAFSATQGQDVYYSLDVLDKRTIISTYADVLTSDKLYTQTIKALGLDTSVQLTSKDKDKPSYKQTTKVLPSSNVLELTVEGPNPDIAARIANNLGQYGINYIKTIYSGYDISILDFAQTPETPISPQPLRDGAVASMLGIVFGALLAITSEEMRAPLAALRDKRNTDRASNALNRRTFTNNLEKELLAHKGTTTTLALISCTGIEDLIGDLPESISVKLLRKISTDLKSQLRGNDIVCRWDSTTFGVMLPNTPTDAALRTVERLRQSLISPVTLESRFDQIHLEPTAGVTSSKNGFTVVDLIKQAETALGETRFADNPTILSLPVEHDEDDEPLEVAAAPAPAPAPDNGSKSRKK